MKEIICYAKDCIRNKDTHCLFKSHDNVMVINPNKECDHYFKNPDYKSRIDKTLTE